MVSTRFDTKPSVPTLATTSYSGILLAEAAELGNLFADQTSVLVLAQIEPKRQPFVRSAGSAIVQPSDIVNGLYDSELIASHGTNKCCSLANDFGRHCTPKPPIEAANVLASTVRRADVGG